MYRYFDAPAGPGRLISFLSLLALLASPAWAQSGSITGTVTDAADGLPLVGANVLVLDSAGLMVTGAATGEDGGYRIASVPTGAYVLRVRFLGFQEHESPVRVDVNQDVVVDVALSEEGFELNTVVITGSRREEKVLDAPASISVLTADDVQGDVGLSSVDALRSTTGVDVAQTGIDRREIVLRGFNNAFSGAAYVLTDYRHAAVASLAVNIYSIMPNMNIDVDRVEVVRGPGSALYGAGVDSGVIHFLSKDPFQHRGTTVSVSGGQQAYGGIQFRHAGVTGKDSNIGYKITGMFGRADDWKMDPSDPIDAEQLEGDVIERNTDYRKSAVNGALEYRFSDRGSLTANMGYATLDATVLSGIGTLQADGFGYTYGQLRFQYDRFFAQAYLNKNRAGKSFVYDQESDTPGTPKPVVDNGILYNVQAQYDFDLGQRQKVIVGADMELTRPDTEESILGRNEDNDSISEVGAYAQSQINLTRSLDLTLALRGDYNRYEAAIGSSGDEATKTVDNFQISPRAAVVVTPTAGHSFRLTYNRAFSSPSTNSSFLDIIAANTPLFDVRARGSAGGFTFQRDASGTPIVSSLLPHSPGTKVPLSELEVDLGTMYAIAYSSLASMTPAEVVEVLKESDIEIAEPTAAALVQLLDPILTQVVGTTAGVPIFPNLTTGEADAVGVSPVDIDPLKQTVTQTIEVGYKGLFENRLLVTLDAYWTRKKNFVGPLLVESPLVMPAILPGTAAEAAFVDAVEGNAVLAGALAQANIDPETVGEVLAGLVAGIPVGIIQAEENDPGVGEIPELMLSYRNFGNVSYVGLDLAFEYMASDRLGVFGNASWVSDNSFDEKELDEEGTGLELSLNASAFKGRLGFSYDTASGISFNVAGRYTDSFPVLSGPYVGDLPSYFLLDVGIGYDLGMRVPGLQLDLGISNVTNKRHRQFIGAPTMGRLGIVRATYSF